MPLIIHYYSQIINTSAIYCGYLLRTKNATSRRTGLYLTCLSRLGFYTGESYEQAVSFVSGFDHSSVYYIRFDDRDLKCRKCKVDQEWMLTIAYYRGALDEYKEYPTVSRSYQILISSDTIDTIDTICYNIPIKSKEDVLCFFVKVKPQS